MRSLPKHPRNIWKQKASNWPNCRVGFSLGVSFVVVVVRVLVFLFSSVFLFTAKVNKQSNPPGIDPCYGSTAAQWVWTAFKWDVKCDRGSNFQWWEVWGFFPSRLGTEGPRWAGLLRSGLSGPAPTPLCGATGPASRELTDGPLGRWVPTGRAKSDGAPCNLCLHLKITLHPQNLESSSPYGRLGRQSSFLLLLDLLLFFSPCSLPLFYGGY